MAVYNFVLSYADLKEPNGIALTHGAHVKGQIKIDAGTSGNQPAASVTITELYDEIDHSNNHPGYTHITDVIDVPSLVAHDFVNNAYSSYPSVNLFRFAVNSFAFTSAIGGAYDDAGAWSLNIQDTIFYLKSTDGYTIDAGTLVITPVSIQCFAQGTRLLTENGYKAIETLTKEDRLLTTENRSISFKLKTTHVPYTTKLTAPYVIAAGALGNNTPIAPLYLSLRHKFALRDNIWIEPPMGARLGIDIKQCPIGQEVTYYHVLCENYSRDVIIAEGVAAEPLGNVKENAIVWTHHKKAGVFIRSEYKEPSKSLKA